MSKKLLTAIALAILCLCVTMTACSTHGIHNDKEWKNVKDPTDETLPFYDTSLPDFDKAGAGKDNASESGWYEVFTDNFDGSELNGDIWTYSPHDVRKCTDDKNHPEYTSYWCPQMVTLNDGMVEIRTEQRSDHVCDSCPKEGRFTGGIETRRVKGDPADNQGNNDELLFAQAFGYFETRVKFPAAEGLWSAFWLQASTQRLPANEGVDGTEIDVYESAFVKNPTWMGHALLWNGYSAPFAKVDDCITDTKNDLYDGFHTFAVKWTPEYYVFYIDGVATWATFGGGVSKVKEFLRLTVEVDNGDAYGPHGQVIGQFKDNSSVFYVDYVKVYQNVNYEKYEIPASNFPGKLNPKN